MNETVLDNLKALYDDYKSYVLDWPLDKIVSVILRNDKEWYNVNTQEITQLYGEQSLEEVSLIRDNKEIQALYARALQLSFDEDVIKERFKKDLKAAFSIINEIIERDKIKSPCQIIFLEHDYEPEFFLHGYGAKEDGKDYPILEKPSYFDYNYNIAVFEAVERIDYSVLIQPIIALEKLIEEINTDDSLIYFMDTKTGKEPFQELKKLYELKAYILLHEVFKEIGDELFKRLPVKKPLFIYGNEHDCESMNIFVYE